MWLRFAHRSHYDSAHFGWSELSSILSMELHWALSRQVAYLLNCAGPIDHLSEFCSDANHSNLNQTCYWIQDSFALMSGWKITHSLMLLSSEPAMQMSLATNVSWKQPKSLYKIGSKWALMYEIQTTNKRTKREGQSIINHESWSIMSDFRNTSAVVAAAAFWTSHRAAASLSERAQFIAVAVLTQVRGTTTKTSTSWSWHCFNLTFRPFETENSSSVSCILSSL